MQRLAVSDIAKLEISESYCVAFIAHLFYVNMIVASSKFHFFHEVSGLKILYSIAGRIVFGR